MLDELLDEGFELEGETGARVTAAMLVALTLRRPHHPKMHEWVERGMEVAHGTADVRVKSFLCVYLELIFFGSATTPGPSASIRRWPSGCRPATLRRWHDSSLESAARFTTRDSPTTRNA